MLKKAISAKIIAISKNEGRCEIMLKTAIIEIPIVINKSSATTLSDKVGPIKKRINTSKVEVLKIGKIM